MKEIKEFDTFSGTDGYVIVDGLDAETQGGRKLLSDIIPSVPVTDVKIGNTTIVSDGVATIPENKTVPTVTPTTDQGKVLKVNDSDQIVWATGGVMTYEEKTLDKSIISGGIVPDQHVKNNSITKIQFNSRVTTSDLQEAEYLLIKVYIDKTSSSEATNCVIEIPGQDVKVNVIMYNYYGPDNNQVISWVTPHFVTIPGTDHPEYFDKDKYIQVRIMGNAADGYTHDDVAPDPGSGS